MRFAAAEAEDEIPEDVHADQGMRHLRMKLDTDKRFFRMADSGMGRVLTYSRHFKSVRQRLDSVSMAHPDLVFRPVLFHTGKDAAGK